VRSSATIGILFSFVVFIDVLILVHSGRENRPLHDDRVYETGIPAAETRRGQSYPEVMNPAATVCQERANMSEQRFQPLFG
jgi:hypothetical protein